MKKEMTNEEIISYVDKYLNEARKHIASLVESRVIQVSKPTKMSILREVIEEMLSTNEQITLDALRNRIKSRRGFIHDKMGLTNFIRDTIRNNPDFNDFEVVKNKFIVKKGDVR